MKEIFKNIPSIDNMYQVSNLGNVRNVNTNTILKKYWPKRRNPYYIVNLKNKDGYRRPYLVHTLMALAFLDKDYLINKKVCDHIDNNPKNNDLRNLRIIDNRENISKSKHPKTGITGVFIDNGSIRVAVQVNGKRHYKSGFKTLKDAKTYRENFLINQSFSK